MTRYLLHALVLAVCLAVPTVARAQTPAEVQDILTDAANRYGIAPAWPLRIVRCETGGTWSPTAVGDGGRSWGLAQLHVNGLRALFYRLGYADPFDAWEAADFLAWALANGYAGHWSCR